MYFFMPVSYMFFVWLEIASITFMYHYLFWDFQFSQIMLPYFMTFQTVFGFCFIITFITGKCFNCFNLYFTSFYVSLLVVQWESFPTCNTSVSLMDPLVIIFLLSGVKNLSTSTKSTSKLSPIVIFVIMPQKRTMRF